MILHVDDRLLHGKILHGWSAFSARRILLISEDLDDEARVSAYKRVAHPVKLQCLLPGVDSLPPEMEGDFWLTDSLSIVKKLLEKKTQITSLVVIGLRQGGEELGPDFAPDSTVRNLLDSLTLKGLKIEIQAFPRAEAWIWPPRSSNTP
jgi:mannose/fructose/N-acetylgalactosamine-specific phosphotransferase system component IIB